jgi:hypothetical protein
MPDSLEQLDLLLLTLNPESGREQLSNGPGAGSGQTVNGGAQLQVQAAGVTMSGEQYPAHPVAAIRAVDDPADHSEPEDCEDDHGGQRRRADP